jgi:hypothetical protein
MANWSQFVRVFVITSAILFISIFISLIVIDPFNFMGLAPGLKRGFIKPYKNDGNPLNDRYAAYTYAQKAEFDSAMFGSSVSYIMKTADFNKGFDSKFINLSMRAALPYEQMVVINRFLRYHPKPKTMIFYMTTPWCTNGTGIRALRDPLGPIPDGDFPMWLFENDSLSKFSHIFNLNALQAAKKQLRFLIKGKGIDPNTYDLYGSSQEPGSNYVRPMEEVIKSIYGEKGKRERDSVNGYDRESFKKALANKDFGRIKLLKEEVVDKIPAETTKIFVILPRHIFVQAPYGTEGYGTAQACKNSIIENFGSMPNTHIIDFLIDGKITRNDGDFFDGDHVNYTGAALLPNMITKAVKDKRSKPGYYNYLK